MAVTLNQTIGSVKETQNTAQSISFASKEYAADVSFWREDIVRVTVRRAGEPLPAGQFALDAQPRQVRITAESSPGQTRLTSSRLSAEINTNPFRLRFRTPDGVVLQEDDPAFGVSWLGDEVARYVKLQPGERFIGLGEKTGGIDRRGAAFVNWNTDYFAYPADGDPLYASVPFYIGVHQGGLYGYFLHNTHRTRFNFGASNRRFAFCTAEGGAMDYFFFTGQTVGELLEAYTWLTGRPFMPPKWSLGYQQCRYSYYPEHEITSLADNFRQRRIPADVLYFDIHYMDRYKVFTWDQTRFPDAKGLHDRLSEQGFKTVIIVDPGVKIEDSYPVYQLAKSEDVAIKYPDGEPFEGEVWPGWCVFPDFTRADVRKWWGSQYAGHVAEGIGGFWNDMNEPSCWGQDIPDLVEFGFEGTKTTHKEARNVYGMQMARATHEGVGKLRPQERPFVLTRAGFSGIQRFAAMWTGDNVANDEHMMAGIRLVISLGLSGVPFAGFDVGGFVGEASPDLYKRWISLGAFMPLFRGHSMINSRDSEPWSYGEEAEEIARNYIALRYQLMPYLYSLFHDAHQNGTPVVRALAYEWPQEPRCYDGLYQNQFLFGPSLMVCPVVSTERYAKVFLPKGLWYDFYSGKAYEGDQEILVEAPSERIPVFARGGSVIPAQKTVQHTGEAVDTLILHVYPGADAQAFTLFEDGGNGYTYRHGDFEAIQLSCAPDQPLGLKVHRLSKRNEASFTQIAVYFHGEEAQKAKGAYFRRYDARRFTKAEMHQATFSFFTPVSAFDPFTKQNDCFGHEPNVPSFAIPFDAEEIYMELRS